MILRIGHRDILVLPLPPKETKVDGLFLNYNNAIHVASTLHPAEQASILLHEIIHALYVIYEWPKKMGEEQVCTRLAPALAAVMRSNPHLCEALECALRSGKPIL